jgi:mxaJ protein
MSSVSKLALLIFVATLLGFCPAFGEEPVLKVAADPNNLPFSNDRLEGFENKIAALLARDLGAELQYIWRAQRRGFFRETLKDGQCDLVMGAPARFERALTTSPYYRSSYVFVSRKEAGLNVTSFDGPILKTARIGVQLIGDDGMNTPPAHALAERGIVTNLVGFTLYGDYSEPNPPARIVEAVAKKEIDLAVVWGPFAGYFASRQSTPLQLTPVTRGTNDPPLAFDISIAVRKSKKDLRDRLNEVLQRRSPEIEKILAAYGIPTEPLKERTAAK